MINPKRKPKRVHGMQAIGSPSRDYLLPFQRDLNVRIWSTWASYSFVELVSKKSKRMPNLESDKEIEIS